MKSRRRIWVAGLVILAAGFGVWLVVFGFGPREPVYQGRRLGDWMVRLDSTNEAEVFEAEHVMTAMGSNAVPFLIYRLRSHALHRYFLFELTLVLHKIHIDRPSLVYGGPTHPITLQNGRYVIHESDADASVHGLLEVGEPAIPSLLNIFEKCSNREVLSQAGMTLSYLESSLGRDYSQFVQNQKSRMSDSAWRKLTNAPLEWNIFPPPP